MLSLVVVASFGLASLALLTVDSQFTEEASHVCKTERGCIGTHPVAMV